MIRIIAPAVIRKGLLFLSLFLCTSFFAQRSDTIRPETRRNRSSEVEHAIYIYAPELAINSVITAAYTINVHERLVLCGFAGPSQTPRLLAEFTPRWGGYTVGGMGALGGEIGRVVWMGGYSRISYVHAGFDFTGYREDPSGRFYISGPEERASYRSRRFEFGLQTMVEIPDSRFRFDFQAGLLLRWSGMFADAALFPGVENDCGPDFPCGTRLLEQNQYHESIALRARVGIGYNLW